MGRNTYLNLYQKTSAAGLPWMWGTWYSNGYKDTVFRSPSAEKGDSKTVASYGKNTIFQREEDATAKTTVISVDPSKFNAARTCLIADNSGKNHSLSPDGDNGNTSINASDGASGSFKRNDKAVVVFPDGHVETISAQRAKELNNKKRRSLPGRRALSSRVTASPS